MVIWLGLVVMWLDSIEYRMVRWLGFAIDRWGVLLLYISLYPSILFTPSNSIFLSQTPHPSCSPLTVWHPPHST